MEISVGHTPDSDDAFMFYGMFTGKVASPDFAVNRVIEDIEKLNRKATDPKIAACLSPQSPALSTVRKRHCHS